MVCSIYFESSYVQTRQGFCNKPKNYKRFSCPTVEPGVITSSLTDSAAHANSKINFHKPIIFAVTSYTIVQYIPDFLILTLINLLLYYLNFSFFFFPWNKRRKYPCNFKYEFEGFTFSFSNWKLIIGNHQNNIYLWRQHMIYCADYHYPAYQVNKEDELLRTE